MERDRRSNAGNRMAKLLDEEEDCQEEFYKVNYGGFQETESDNEYEAEVEDEGEDIVDSDFSIDENDEPVSDTELDENRQKKRLITKAYKEPVAQRKEKSNLKHETSTPKSRSLPHYSNSEKYERKSIRKSTAAKTAETAYRLKVRDMEQRKRVKKNIVEEWMPTQEELLEEAKLTEAENIKSLEKFQKLENEKKITRPTKRLCTGPVLQYKSTRMPLIEEPLSTKVEHNISTEKYCERTFITMLNDPHDIVFNKVFRFVAPTPPKKLKCSVTGMPAKYVDPVTSVPYHSSTCLKIIRLAYYEYLENNGDKSNSLVSDFLKWYTKNKRRLRNELLIPEPKTSQQ